jgi:hypothetical protein
VVHRSQVFQTVSNTFQHFHTTPNTVYSMPRVYQLSSDRYMSNNGHGSIHRRPSNSCLVGRPDFGRPYPAPETMVAWAESLDSLPSEDVYCDASHDDQLWMLTCRGVQSQNRRRGRVGHGNTAILNDLFRLGQFDWEEWQKPSPANTRAFRYTAALGQELLSRIERAEDRVRPPGSRV